MELIGDHLHWSICRRESITISSSSWDDLCGKSHRPRHISQPKLDFFFFCCFFVCLFGSRVVFTDWNCCLHSGQQIFRINREREREKWHWMKYAGTPVGGLNTFIHSAAGGRVPATLPDNWSTSQRDRWLDRWFNQWPCILNISAARFTRRAQKPSDSMENYAWAMIHPTLLLFLFIQCLLWIYAPLWLLSWSDCFIFCFIFVFHKHYYYDYFFSFPLHLQRFRSSDVIYMGCLRPSELVLQCSAAR